MAKENVNPLKMLVFSMGLVLVGGVVLLATLVWQKISTEAAVAKNIANCPGGQIDLKGRGPIVDSVVDGHTMRIVLEKRPGVTEMVLVDMCSGTITGSLKIDSDTATITE